MFDVSNVTTYLRFNSTKSMMLESFAELLKYFDQTYFKNKFFQVMSNPAKALLFIAHAMEL